MPLSEFSLIERFFRQDQLCPSAAGLELGIGDDAALLRVPPDRQLVVCADTLVAGVHFPDGIAASDVGFRALAVNLSDLAAMAAEPRWYTLCLTLPAPDQDWLANFCQGLVAAAADTDVSLIGGDTSAGPLSITVQMLGLVEPGQATLRSGARPGDAVYVTGNLGDAAAGLAALLAHGDRSAADESETYLRTRFLRPTARLREAALLRGLARSCIDISDGLLADLGHLCAQSGVAARIDWARLPLSPALRALPGEQALQYVLAGGDDYELCFTVPAAQREPLERRFTAAGCHCYYLGDIVQGAGVRCVDQNGVTLGPKRMGYEHFRL